MVKISHLITTIFLVSILLAIHTQGTKIEIGQTQQNKQVIYHSIILHSNTLPPPTGDWIIDSIVQIENKTLIINGNIIIKQEGTLILKNSQLYMNLSYGGEYRIETYGNLTMRNTTITAYNTTNRYCMRIYNTSKLYIENSTISYVGISDTDPRNGSIWINTNQAKIINTTIERVVLGLFLENSSGSIIYNNKFINNVWMSIALGNSTGNYVWNNQIINTYGDGIYLRNSQNNYIHDNILRDNDIGINLYKSSNNLIYNNEILDVLKDGGIRLTNSNNNKIFNNTIANPYYETSIVISDSTNNTIIYNNIYDYGGTWSETTLTTNIKVMYIYNNTTYQHEIGNYWSPYTGNDTDNDGIGDTPYNNDIAPLITTKENYIICDEDNDQLNDIEEYIHGTDPLNNDTDHDGIPDGIEIKTYHLDPLNNDTDHDGIPDLWEIQQSLNPLNASDASGDADNDGLTNLEEYQHGTDPRNADTDGDGMPDGWEVEHGLNATSNDALEDADGDGLTNLEEYQHGTDPANPDSDGDGMPDGWEAAHSFDPLNASDASGDADNDGLTNLEEYQHGTDPRNADTDGDGMPDGWEVEHGLNATSNDALEDADGDGLTNLEEYQHGTDPRNADTDGDGYSDGVEVNDGFDPLDSSDHPSSDATLLFVGFALVGIVAIVSVVFLRRYKRGL